MRRATRSSRATREMPEEYRRELERRVVQLVLVQHGSVDASRFSSCSVHPAASHPRDLPLALLLSLLGTHPQTLILAQPHILDQPHRDDQRSAQRKRSHREQQLRVAVRGDDRCALSSADRVG